jgi:hypothetical protein
MGAGTSINGDSGLCVDESLKLFAEVTAGFSDVDRLLSMENCDTHKSTDIEYTCKKEREHDIIEHDTSSEELSPWDPKVLQKIADLDDKDNFKNHLGAFASNLRSTLVRWERRAAFNSRIIKCDLLDLEDAVELAFDGALTPLLLDISLDDKVCTFYSYQPPVVCLDCRELIMMGEKNRMVAFEYARKHLVTAMKHGKTLLLRLDTSACAFRRLYCDEAMFGQYYHSRDLKGAAKREAFFPACTLLNAGRELHDDYWVYKLFRENDMFPHKNIAVCLPTFRVMVTSRLPLRDAALNLFGIDLDANNGESGFDHCTFDLESAAALPAAKHFQFVSIHYESDDEKENTLNDASTGT